MKTQITSKIASPDFDVIIRDVAIPADSDSSAQVKVNDAIEGRTRFSLKARRAFQNAGCSREELLVKSFELQFIFELEECEPPDAFREVATECKKLTEHGFRLPE